MSFQLNPNFSNTQGNNSTITFQTGELNYLLETQVVDRFSLWQEKFGVFNFMKLTNELKHVIYFPSTSPLMWQPLQSCSWDPIGDAKMGKTEIAPCKAKVNLEWCWDSLLDSCFKHFLKYEGGGVKIEGDGDRLVNMLLKSILQSMVVGARLMLSVGKMYDYAKIEPYFKKTVTEEQKRLIEKTVGTCRGWVELAEEMGKAKYPWMNCKDLLSCDDFDPASGKYKQNILELFDSLLEKAQPDFCDLIDSGGFEVIGDGGSIEPIIIVSGSFHKCLAMSYKKMCDDPLCKNPRITRELCTMNGRSMKVYHIDDIPVMPLHDLNCYDKYLNGGTSLFVLTTTRNIQLGASATNLNSLGEGVRIQKSELNKTYGEVTMLQHGLFSTAIANPDLFVGTQIFCGFETA